MEMNWKYLLLFLTQEGEVSMDNKIKELWQEFGDIPMNPETEEIEQEWHDFPVGTNIEEIWHWFEDQFDISVADLMYG